jgi:hypothetical protein
MGGIDRVDSNLINYLMMKTRRKKYCQTYFCTSLIKQFGIPTPSIVIKWWTEKSPAIHD